MIAQAAMAEEIARAGLEEVADLRDRYKSELNGVVVHEGGVLRGWFEIGAVRRAGQAIGYGVVARGDGHAGLVEFFLLPEERARATPILDRLLDRSGVTHIVANTSDSALLVALYDYCGDIAGPELVFRDTFNSEALLGGLVFRRITLDDMAALYPVVHRPDWYPFELSYPNILLKADEIERHRSPAYPFETTREEDMRGWIAGGFGWLLQDGEDIVGLGAIYPKNPPYVDLAMMVREPFQHRGYGTRIIQQLKAVCYETGLIPTAKCFAWNIASRRTLQRAGFVPCGRLLIGKVKAGGG